MCAARPTAPALEAHVENASRALGSVPGTAADACGLIGDPLEREGTTSDAWEGGSLVDQPPSLITTRTLFQGERPADPPSRQSSRAVRWCRHSAPRPRVP